MSGALHRVSPWLRDCLLLIIGFSTAPQLSSADLAEQLKPLVSGYAGEVAIAVRHLESGEEYFERADEVQPTASLIKLAVMVTAYRQSDSGLLNLQDLIELKASDKVPGSGILTTHFSEGLKISLRDTVRLMIRDSDNTATNLVVQRIGLPSIAACMQELGYPETRLNSLVYRGDTTIAPERSRLFGLGSTTARETLALLQSIHRGTAASEASCNAMMEHLHSCEDRSMLARELPPGTKIAHKSGAVAASRCDAGIIQGPKGPFAICVLTTDNKDRSWDDTNAAHLLIGRIARVAFDHFNPPWASGSDPDPALKSGAFGVRVEMLQRSLNAKLTPSPNLGVDGDFGPATESAVRRFQESQGLAVDGVVSSEFWKRMGPVVEESPVAAPAVVNTEVLPRQPADPLTGPPAVTCEAWTIVDAESGQELAGFQSAVRLDFASTTKMMTAWLVARMAEKTPEVLSEMLTVSERADQTRGSTADVRRGEALNIEEALYGLMLPSGNDMSVALAEHFGGRILTELELTIPADQQVSEDPMQQFVLAMNAEAIRLGMSQTHYENPHGLTDPRHLSTAMDLSLLARAMRSSELLRRVTSTRQRGAMVAGPGGYSRFVVWKNTNELLEIEGFEGVKTGTTDKAGSCLVSIGQRNGRPLIVVVLGSAASEARYTDSRNLYRWAWKDLLMLQDTSGR
ncbi:MAG: serine hydrolase [Planctomycetia bacterium]